MSYIRIYVHCVWTTKNRTPILEQTKCIALCQHIKQYSKVCNTYIDCINGYKDHIHCLIGLGRAQSVAGIMSLIKGESAAWANRTKLFDTPLQWAVGYYAISVGVNALPIVREYIRNQEKHHANNT